MLAIRHPPPLPRKNSESGGNSGTFRTSNIGIVGEIVAMPGVALRLTISQFISESGSLLLRTVSASSIVREDSTELIESRRTSTILLAAFRDLWVCLVLTMYYRGRVREGGLRGRELRKNNSTIWSNPKEMD